MNIPIAGTIPSHEMNSFSNSTVFRPDLYIPTQCQVIRSSATWSAGIGEVDGKSEVTCFFKDFVGLIIPYDTVWCRMVPYGTVSYRIF